MLVWFLYAENVSDSAECPDVAQLCFLPWITIIDLLQGLNWTFFLQQESYTTNTVIPAKHDASAMRDPPISGLQTI